MFQGSERKIGKDKDAWLPYTVVWESASDTNTRRKCMDSGKYYRCEEDWFGSVYLYRYMHALNSNTPADQTGRTLQIYRGHLGPVTTLAFCDKVYGSGDGKILITGSWDQVFQFTFVQIATCWHECLDHQVVGHRSMRILEWDFDVCWSKNLQTKEVISSTDAHSDFVKSLFVFPSLQLLVSGSSDKIVRFWCFLHIIPMVKRGSSPSCAGIYRQWTQENH